MAEHPHTIECGDPRARTMAATRTLVKEGRDARGRRVVLERVTEGYEVAGSAMRWTRGGHRVAVHQPDGTTTGRRGLYYPEAEAMFRRLAEDPR